MIFLAIFWNEITTILTPSTSEGVGMVTFFVLEIPVGAGPLMDEPYCFWKQLAGKCAPKTSSSGLNQTVLGFLRKNLKTVFGTPFPPSQKKRLYSFLSNIPFLQKWLCPPKIILRCYFGKYCFSRKSC